MLCILCAANIYKSIYLHYHLTIHNIIVVYHTHTHTPFYIQIPMFVYIILSVFILLYSLPIHHAFNPLKTLIDRSLTIGGHKCVCTARDWKKKYFYMFQCYYQWRETMTQKNYLKWKKHLRCALDKDKSCYFWYNFFFIEAFLKKSKILNLYI